MGSINRLLIPISILILSITFYLFLEIRSIQKEQESNALLQKTEKIAKALNALRKQYTTEVLKEVQHTDIHITNDYKNEKYDTLGGAIPLPSNLSMDIAKELSSKNTKIELYSNYPFPWKNNRVLTSFQKDALTYFESNKLSDKPFYAFDEEKQVLNYAIPEKMMDKTCINCHNNHAQTPIKNWVIGDIRGAISITAPIEHNVLLEEANYKIIGLFIFSFTCVILIVSIVSLRNKNLLNAITDINSAIIQMRKGRYPDKIKPTSTSLVEVAKNINFLANRINRVSEFTEEIGKGNFKAEFMAYDKSDILGNMLITMKQQLMQESEDSFKRNWGSIGKNQIADIIQKNSNNPKSVLFQEIIDFLVEYIDIQMAGMYVLNDALETEPYLEIAACYAFNFNKNESPKVEIKGLIKEAYIEKKTVYITDIPDNKIEINSGLIKSKPNILLLIPMMINQKVYGIIELASLNPIEPHQISFLENIGNNIAATISEINKNENTVRALDETKMLSKSLEVQKEELHQAKIVIEEKNTEIETMRLEEKMHLEAQIQNQKKHSDALIKEYNKKDKNKQIVIDQMEKIIESILSKKQIIEIQKSWNDIISNGKKFEEEYCEKIVETTFKDANVISKNISEKKGKLKDIISKFTLDLNNINLLIDEHNFNFSFSKSEEYKLHETALTHCLQTNINKNWNMETQQSWSLIIPILSKIISVEFSGQD